MDYKYHVGYIPNVSDPGTVTIVHIDSIIKGIKGGKWWHLVQQGREMDRDAYKQFKATQVPAFTAHGPCTYASNAGMITGNGLALMDFDHIADVNATKKKLSTCPYTRFMFTSFGGKGLAVIVEIPEVDSPELFEEQHAGLRHYYDSEFNLICDEGAKSFKCLRLVSFDPDLFHNPGSMIWHTKPILKPTRRRGHPIRPNPATTIEQLAARHLTKDSHHPQIMRFIAACRSCDIPREEVEVFLETCGIISPESAHANPAKTRRDITDIYNRYEPAEKAASPTASRGTAVEITEQWLTIENNVVYNEIKQRFEMNGEPLNEQEINSLYLAMVKEYRSMKTLTKSMFDTVLNSTSIPAINPIHVFFKHHHARDPRGAISALCASIRRKNPEINIDPFIRKWLVGMIARAFEGCYNPLMIVLIGPKNVGKTEFFRRLLPEDLRPYFAQSKFQDGKDSEALMCENLLILNDELDGLHAREAKAFRNFISADYYSYRPPYAKLNVKRKRLASVCGTSNDGLIIQDALNNRRIIPIEITGIDYHAYNDIDKVSLIAEAYQHFSSNYDYSLSDEEIPQLEELSTSHEIESVEFELCNAHCRPFPGPGMTATEVMNKLSSRTTYRLSAHRVGAALRRLGFERKSERTQLGPRYVYKIILDFDIQPDTTPDLF